MRTPLHWLGRYVQIEDVSLVELCEKMVGVGLEIEEIERPDDEIDRVVVGRVSAIRRHENSDKLWICDIDAGEMIQIVTGAQNVTAGALIPVALDGATLPGGKKIVTGMLRGVLSQGMLCSGEELGVSKDVYPYDDGILIFREEHAIGADVKPLLGIHGPIVDFGVTANRPDCQCVLGLAREASVALRKPFTPPVGTTKEAAGEDVGAFARVDIEAPDLCPRYMARVVRNIKIAPSPDWMRQALAAAGVRPINNIVDITNFVMLEMGHPMHAFDLSNVNGGHIIVRRAREGEALRTLDGIERKLSTSMLVIADDSGATGLAGVMGGEGSQIVDGTRDVLFECACFDTASIRVTSRSLNLRSESSARFEKGVSIHTLPAALERAVQLVEELGAGEVVRGVIDVYPKPAPHAPIRTTLDRISRHIGVNITADTALSILLSLGFEASEIGGALCVTPPPWRQDVYGYADIAEEILRVYGYDNVPSSVPSTSSAGKNTPRNIFYGKVRKQLAGMGLCEISTVSFMSPRTSDKLGLARGDARREAIAVLNPLGEDTSLLRTLLYPAMLDTLALNQSRGSVNARLFEVSRTFTPTQDVLPDEKNVLCFGMVGEGADFFALKSAVDTLLALHRTPDVEWSDGCEVFMHPGRRATVLSSGSAIAAVGELHPDIAEKWGIRGRVAIAQLDLDMLESLSGATVIFEPMPKFPAVARDIALVVDESVTVGALMKTARCAGRPLMETIELFDIYRSEALGASVKSVALSMTFRSPEKTLVDAEIQHAVDAVLAACKTEYGAVLRT